MLRRIAVLALLVGILPAAVQALPRGSGTDAPAAVKPQSLPQDGDTGVTIDLNG